MYKEQVTKLSGEKELLHLAWQNDFKRVMLGKAIQKYNISFQLSMVGQQACGQNNRGRYHQAGKKSLSGPANCQAFPAQGI